MVELLTACDVTDAWWNWIVRCCQGGLRYTQPCSAATITAVVLSYVHDAVIPPNIKNWRGGGRCQREMIIAALLILLLVMNPGREDPWDVYKILAIYSTR